MAEPAHTGTNEEVFHCPHCGEDFPTNGKNEGDCPVCGTHCDREKCHVRNASNEGF